MITTKRLLTALILSSTCAAPALAIDAAPMPNPQVDDVTALSGVSVSAGVAYWQGNFGLPRSSELFVAPISVRYDAGKVRFWATLPYMRIESDAALFAGTDGGPIVASPIAAPGTPRVREGLGDLTIGGTWSLAPENENALDIDVTARVKLPTASDSSGLSTGKTDVSLSVDLSKPVGGVVPYVSAGYRLLGNPDGFDLNNTLHLATGVSVPLGTQGDTVLLLSYEYDEAPTRFVDDGHEIFGAVSGSIDDRFSWTGYGSVGLSDGASDFALGLLLTVAL